MNRFLGSITEHEDDPFWKIQMYIDAKKELQRWKETALLLTADVKEARAWARERHQRLQAMKMAYRGIVEEFRKLEAENAEIKATLELAMQRWSTELTKRIDARHWARDIFALYRKQLLDNARLRELIKSVEWHHTGKDHYWPQCPWCFEWRDSGHSPTCPAFNQNGSIK